jgi:uncharacterized lipoprotein YddW (UPF0748 family)
VDSTWIDAVLPQCYRYDISGYTATVQQQKAAHRNPAVPLYPGVLLRSGTYTASASMLSQMIQTNRNNGFKGESFFFYQGIKDVSSWFAGQYPFIK